MLSAAGARITTPDRVRMVLAELLHAGDPSGQRVAQRLGMSLRTLQRQLTAAGTTFHAVLIQQATERLPPVEEAMIRSVSAGGGTEADALVRAGSRCASINRLSSVTSAALRTSCSTK